MATIPKQQAISTIRQLLSLYDQDSNFSQEERQQLAEMAFLGGLTQEEAVQASENMITPFIYQNYQAENAGQGTDQNTGGQSAQPAMTPLQSLISGALSDGTVSQSEIDDILGVSQDPNQISSVASEFGFNISPDDVGQIISGQNTGQPQNNTSSGQNGGGQSNTNLPSIENLGNTFADNFGNNPGALGFADLNPIVTGAESTQQAAIPEALKPFLAQSIDASQGAMTGLTELLARDNAMTSPFNSLQEQAQQQALGVAAGEGGFLPNSQNALTEIADSSDIFDLFNRGANLLENPQGINMLSELSQGSSLNPIAQNTLESTASGDFLFGNPAFDEAVQASIRAARPHILSRFAQGGSGAVGSGLAQTAIQQAASDAFASRFGEERNRMLGASGQLNNSGLADRSMNLNAANSLIGAQQNAGGIFSDIANADRSRQFSAAQLLPQFGLLQSQITGGVGNQRQQQEERTKLGQIQAMQGLLNSSFGNINPNSLFGNINSVQSNGNSLLTGLGGLATGAGILDTFGLAEPVGNFIGGLFD